MTAFLVLGGAAAVGVAGVVCVAFMRASVLFSLALACTMFSGYSSQLGLPIGPDRLLFLAGVGSLLLGFARPGAIGTRRFRLVDGVLIVAAVAVVASAVATGTFGVDSGLFGVLDRFGIVPFAVFMLAPVVFVDDHDRRVLLGTLTICGAYLGITAFGEITGQRSFVFPRYINNPLIGIHFGRARGPFGESAANGLALFQCAVAAAVGFQLFRARWQRWGSVVVVALCFAGIFFTLTRAVWLGAVVGCMVAAAIHPRLRRFIGPGIVAGGLGLVLALAVVPGLSDKASSRANEEGSIWDRLNTNDAAIRAFKEHPLTGIGWDTFAFDGPEFMRQADDFPLTGAGIKVHNVLLSNLAETGVVTTSLWLVGMGLAVAAAWRGSRNLPIAWRAGTAAVLVDWTIAANLGPLPYAFPNQGLWIWLGVASASTALVPRTPDDRLELPDLEPMAPPTEPAYAGALA